MTNQTTVSVTNAATQIVASNSSRRSIYIVNNGSVIANTAGRTFTISPATFINNGTDAIEGAIKLARLYTKKTGFISTTGGFHGKSMGSLSVMGRAVYRKPFHPLLPDIFFVDYGDIKDMERELRKLHDLGEDIAAVIRPLEALAGVEVRAH